MPCKCKKSAENTLEHMPYLCAKNSGEETEA